MPVAAQKRPSTASPFRRRGTSWIAAAGAAACLLAAPAGPPPSLANSPVQLATQPGFVPGQPAPVLMERGRLLLAFARQWVC